MTGWRRVRREMLRVVLALLALELIVRVGPIQTLLANRLGPYENMLWHDMRMVTYRSQLQNHPDSSLWVIGSSPTMTGINPDRTQTALRQNGYPDFTVQSFTFSALLNLEVMAVAVDRWLLEMGQPEYVVLGISDLNFSQNVQEHMRIQDGPMESVMIYADSFDDYITRFFYEHSQLYQSAVLVRNALTFPVEDTLPDPVVDRSYVEMTNEHSCPELDREEAIHRERVLNHARLDAGLRRLDAMVEMIRTRGLPLMVVSLPVARCRLENGYGTEAFYRANFLDPIGQHLAQRGIPFVELDSLFMNHVPADEQNSYFDNGTHPNKRGADLLSVLLADAVDDWLRNGQSPG